MKCIRDEKTCYEDGMIFLRLTYWLLALIGISVLCTGLDAAPAYAAEFDSPREHRLAYRAHKELENEDYEACLDVLSSYISENESPAATLFVLQAQAHSGLGQESKALATYARAAKLYPENELILRNYAVTSQQAGRMTQAARLFERAQAQGGDAELLYQAGAAWFQTKHYSRAAKVIQQLIARRAEPKMEWVELLVYSLIQDRQWRQAENQLRNLLHDRPGNADLWRMLAHIRSEQGDLLGAASALELAYDIGHAGAKKWRDVASMYASAGVPMMAVRAMRKGMGESPEPEHCWRMGRLYAQALRIDAAVEWMDKALARERRPGWLLEKAQMLYSHQRYAHSREAATAAAKAYPEVRGEAWMLAGYAAWQKQDWQTAKEAFALAAKVEETASRAAACLQTMNRILESQHKIRMADSSSGRPRMGSDAETGERAGVNQNRDHHS